MDFTMCQTYGLEKQGGSRFTYNHVRGYHLLLATAAGLGDVLRCRLRGGPANSGHGAASFASETFSRVRRAGAGGPLVLRADSGFYSRKVVEACGRHGVRLSITVRLNRKLHKLISEIHNEASPSSRESSAPTTHSSPTVTATPSTSGRTIAATPLLRFAGRL
ncbi:MAG: transposase [Candidatus Dormibacteria bacterium]